MRLRSVRFIDNKVEFSYDDMKGIYGVLLVPPSVVMQFVALMQAAEDAIKYPHHEAHHQHYWSIQSFSDTIPPTAQLYCTYCGATMEMQGNA